MKSWQFEVEYTLDEEWPDQSCLNWEDGEWVEYFFTLEGDASGTAGPESKEVGGGGHSQPEQCGSWHGPIDYEFDFDFTEVEGSWSCAPNPEVPCRPPDSGSITDVHLELQIMYTTGDKVRNVGGTCCPRIYCRCVVSWTGTTACTNTIDARTKPPSDSWPQIGLLTLDEIEIPLYGESADTELNITIERDASWS